MHKKMSPEERLLALIRGKHKKAESPAPHQAAGPRPEQKEKNLPSFISAALASKIFKDISKNRLFEPAFLKALNRYLAGALILLAVIFLADLIFIRPYKKVDMIIAQSREASGRTPAASTGQVAQSADYSKYSQDIASKKIFGASLAGQGGPSQIVTGEDDLLKDVGLVGIMPGDAPQAIIEDKKNERTYYLKRGESFNGIVVDDIADGKVVLDYDGRKLTLFL